MIPCHNSISTSICYKESDSQSYLKFTSSHPRMCITSIPCRQFLRLKRICSDVEDFARAADKMEIFFFWHAVTLLILYAQGVFDVLFDTFVNVTTTNRIPMVTTFHPKNVEVNRILSDKFSAIDVDKYLGITITRDLSWNTHAT